MNCRKFSYNLPGVMKVTITGYLYLERLVRVAQARYCINRVTKENGRRKERDKVSPGATIELVSDRGVCENKK